MVRNMLLSKIHRATVTGADLHYEGSVTIDGALLDRADILPNQEVEIWNVTSGDRFRTYALRGQSDSGVLCINGAAAHKASRGDLVIIAAFGLMSEEEARSYKPKLVFVDEHNHPVERTAEYAGQAELKAVNWQ